MWAYIIILLLQLGELIDVKFFGTISVAGIFYIIWFLYNVISGGLGFRITFKAAIENLYTLSKSLFPSVSLGSVGWK